MKHRLIGCLLLFAGFLLAPSSSFAKYDPDWTWRTLKNDHFIIYYPAGHESAAARVLSLEDEVYGDITGYLGVTPPLCPIVINPGTDLFNGFYSPFPNRISLYETPYFSVRGFGPASDGMDLLFTHEYAHFSHLTTRLGWYGRLTPLLGRDSAITNILSPGWLTEGITTNSETLYTDGGRGRCSLFKGEMMSFAEGEGLWNLSAAGTYSPYQPPSSRIYLSGYFMVDYLNRTYGKDAFARLGRYQAEHPLGLSGEALQSVTGKSGSEFYSDFLADFNKQAQDMKNLAKSMMLPDGKTIHADNRETIVDHFWLDNTTILALRSGYDKTNALLEINPATGQVVHETKTGTINALPRISSMNDGSRIAFAGYYPRILGEGELVDTDLTVFDWKARSYKRLTHGAHIFSASLSHDKYQFTAVRRNGMWTELLTMDSDGSSPNTLFSKPGYQIEDPRYSPDDKQIVCVVKSGRNSDIALVNPVSGDLRTLFASDAFEDNDPSFSPDGTWIVFSSNRSGTWNIFAWDLVQGKLYQLTSVSYGATCPRFSPDGKSVSFLSLYRGVNQLKAIPFDPVHGQKFFVKKGSEPEKPDLARLTPHPELNPVKPDALGIYSPFLHIPFFMTDPDDSKFGILLLGGDPVGINSYSAYFDYGLNSHHPGYDLTYKNRSFWPDIIAGAFDKAKDLSIAGNDFWIQERGIQLATGFNMIHRIVPDHTASSIIAGTRFKWLKSLDEPHLIIHENWNEARSFFAEWTIAHHPDAPKRDLLPTWGQDMIMLYEKTMPDLGSELDARNIVLSLSQYLPSPIEHHGFALKAVLQKQYGNMTFDKDYSLPRGYSTSDTEGGLDRSNNLLLSTEYHFPIRYLDNGPGLSILHFHVLKSFVFADWGGGWDHTFNADDWISEARPVVGASFRANTSLFSIIPMEFGIESGYKTKDRESFVNLVLLLGI